MLLIYLYFYFYNINLNNTQLSFYRWFNNNNLNHHELENFLSVTYSFSRDLYDLGFSFYTDYFYIFLMCGVILLLSIVVPIVLTFKKPYSSKVSSQNPSIQLKRTKFNSILFKNLKG